MCRMCAYSGASAPIAQMFVESDSGDILSPRYAPATTAPAVAPSGASSAAAVPISATPIVPADPHDVPVASDIADVARNAVSTSSSGRTKRTPQYTSQGIVPDSTQV